MPWEPELGILIHTYLFETQWRKQSFLMTIPPGLWEGQGSLAEDWRVWKQMPWVGGWVHRENQGLWSWVKTMAQLGTSNPSCRPLCLFIGCLHETVQRLFQNCFSSWKQLKPAHSQIYKVLDISRLLKFLFFPYRTHISFLLPDACSNSCSIIIIIILLLSVSGSSVHTYMEIHRMETKVS